MDAAAIAETGQIVERSARTWAARTGVRADDLAQEGWLAAIEARRRWDGRRPWAPYAQATIGHAMGWAAAAARAPASGRHRRAHIATLIRLPLDPAMRDPAPSPEELAALRLRRDRIAARLAAALGDGSDGAIARAVLIGGRSMRATAAARRAPVRRVAAAVAAARERIANDSNLAQLWHDG